MKLQLPILLVLLWCLCGVCGFEDEVEAPQYGSFIRQTMPEVPDFEPEWKPATVSYYGQAFHGRKMANGERFNAFGHSGIPTVAHKTLPFGTLIEFKNPKNGRRIRTRVADRGPYVRGRQFDLSEWTAIRLGVKGQGVAKLEYAVVGRLKGEGKRNSTQGHG